ncbi:phage Gp37/Gp68 family protein [Burkholderia pseudomallei]|uniref:phage Gp37/Gp68 family protein n=1 Tax=Burkholderia pseudomallei TaxID=28450 RepID=UPI0003D94282|nr:phage Gp37/Gp68 family protein [Burkholderia pseudomallei]AHE33808.1 phage Gp37/Gp68 family protein [Burkholderia pseudomallei NAU20B-16]AHG34347.1 phage Gp37/Gp68 family protein [Burkholderia pseudomallei MSHR511]AHG68430.1 phage Gp37/Gp68 family protein [Burkholderia pseudomallei MSHR146]AIS91846.1 phage Gp37/Gp68 family protein [Burkholderia pseudomallei NAU35A-3]KGV91929.1 phage Gp37/Gp68 family protein [Burkholderia pseudomallei ABCPW 30]
MSENSKIEWCDHTFNAWIGCTKISPGCDHCYAERERASTALRVVWGAGNPRHRTAASTWNNPKRWNARHGEFFAKHDRRQRVFCASLSDVFDNAVPPAWRMDLFRLIGDTQNLDWLLLTKRIGNAAAMLCEIGLDRLPDNVWLGATIVNQEEADRDIPKLLAVPARVRFLSMEPLLGPVDLVSSGALWSDMNGNIVDAPSRGLRGIDWVIAGGESGPGARPMHPDWARSLRDQCAAASVPFLFKQWGEWCPRGPESMGYPLVDTAPRRRITDVGESGQRLGARGGSDCWMQRAGKRATGRLLDSRTHDEFPRSQS